MKAFTPKPDRIYCEVPFCRRSDAKAKHEEGTRIICAKHFRLGDEKYRKLYSRATRLIKRGIQGTMLDAAYWSQHRAWCRIRIQAIERSGGVS